MKVGRGRQHNNVLLVDHYYVWIGAQDCWDLQSRRICNTSQNYLFIMKKISGYVSSTYSLVENCPLGNNYHIPPGCTYVITNWAPVVSRPGFQGRKQEKPLLDWSDIILHKAGWNLCRCVTIAKSMDQIRSRSEAADGQQSILYFPSFWSVHNCYVYSVIIPLEQQCHKWVA